MDTTLPLHALETETAQIIGDVFRTMLSLDVEPRFDRRSPRPGDLTAAVFFAGSYQGGVLLECAPEQACSLSARLSGGEPSPVFDEDARDAMGELANMIGGNLKAVLPRGCVLSLPSVVTGADYALRVRGARDVHRITYVSELGEFVVNLIEVPAAD